MPNKKKQRKKTQVGIGATGSAQAIKPYTYEPPKPNRKEREFEIPDIGMAFKKVRNTITRAQAQEPVVPKPPKKKVKRK